MVDKIAINRIVNANVYANGNSLLGKVEEIGLPSIKIKTVEHKTLGLVGTLELPAGIEKMEGKIKWTSFYDDALILMANPFNFIQLQVRGSLETYTAQGRAAQVPVVAVMTIFSKDLPLGAFKQHDPVDMETNYTALYTKLTVGDKDIVEFDVLANIYKVGGEDILLEYKNNIGG